MKLSVRTMLVPALLAFVLVGCSSNDEEELVLPEIDNKVTPDYVWSSSVGDGIEHYDSKIKPAVFGDKVFVASRAGEIVAFNLQNGDKLWSYDLRNGDDAPLFAGISHWWNNRNAKLAGGVAVGFDKVLVGTEDGDVLALNPETGEKVWQVKVKGEVLAAPVAGEGLILVNTGGGRIFALQPDTGEQRWMHETENALLTLRGISSVAAAAGGVVFGTGNGKVGVLISEQGAPAWEEAVAVAKGSTDLARIIDVDATPIVQNGTIYAIAYNGQLVAMELRSGRVLWKRDYASFRDMQIVDNIIYLVDSTGKLYAVDTRNGLEIWSQQTLHKHFVTGPAVYKNYLVVGDNEGNLHWFSRDKGEYLARHEFDSSGFYAEAVSTSDYLILQTRNGEIDVLRTAD
ncbi:MAG: outer membrane protein assembly factor BamB [Rheinheimera sp.]|nr:outer membrane protein assembly factor BamB [Rheinheimera sp.]